MCRARGPGCSFAGSPTRRIIAVNRNLSFFTNGYNYLIQIIPALIVAPLYMRGDVEFGEPPEKCPICGLAGSKYVKVA